MLKAKDLAKEFGISPAAMSLIINDKPGVSDKTREDVILRMNAMGYGHLLKNNSYGETAPKKNITFVIYHDGGELLGANNNSFFPFIIDGIERCARRHGYNLTYLNISREKVNEQIDLITQSNCVGYIVFATEMNGNQIDPFINLGIPFVLLDAYYNNRDVNSVTVNNEQGTYLAVEHLVNSGHKKIGYLTSGLELTSFVDRRYWAFKAMKAFGLTGMEQYKYEIGYPDTEAYVGMKALLESCAELPTAFLTDNDLIAVGAMRALKEAGYRIPEDISFVGFDDRPVCTMVEPPLTTVQIPRNSFGAEAVELLLRQIEGGTECIVKTELNNKLIVRDSVAKLKK